jgi:hypothetical protein
MNNQFDELTKSLAQSVTRRAALKKFGVGLAGMALAAFGLADRAGAVPHKIPPTYCQLRRPSWSGRSFAYTGLCTDIERCVSVASADCPASGTLAGNTSVIKVACGIGLNSPVYDTTMRCSFPI